MIQRLLAYEAFPDKTPHPHALDGAELVLELLALTAEARAHETADPTMGHDPTRHRSH